MNKKLIIMLIVAAIIVIIAISISNNKNEVFEATVLENMGTSLLVKPIQGEGELSSSDKIVVRVSQKNGKLIDVSEFTVGSKVKITYNGIIMESYPAQINASKISFVK